MDRLDRLRRIGDSQKQFICSLVWESRNGRGHAPINWTNEFVIRACNFYSLIDSVVNEREGCSYVVVVAEWKRRKVPQLQIPLQYY